MKQMIVACALCVGLMTGCCKKKEKEHTQKKHKHTVAMRETAAPQTVPVYAQNTSEMLDDDFATNFAFAEGSDLFGNELDNALVAEMDQTESSELVAEAEALDTIKFDFNKNDIRKDQAEVLTKDVVLAKQAAAEGKEIVVRGHTCQMGSASYNLALSQKRADTVKHEMVKRGIPADKIRTVGVGFESPLVSSNATDRVAKIKELSPNRRAEILIHS